jgi:hypothetical protein
MNELPHAISDNTITILGVEITVSVLSDGTRIFDKDGFERLLEVMAYGPKMSPDDAMEIAKAISQ